MNKRTLWLGWAAMGISAVIFYLCGWRDFAPAFMAGGTVLGWMATATKE